MTRTPHLQGTIPHGYNPRAKEEATLPIKEKIFQPIHVHKTLLLHQSWPRLPLAGVSINTILSEVLANPQAETHHNTSESRVLRKNTQLKQPRQGEAVTQNAARSLGSGKTMYTLKTHRCRS